MITLYPFQASAASELADAVVEYFSNPVELTRGRNRERFPYVHLLSSVTASGKTVILTEAIARIAKCLPIAPVVLWLSKATVVVEQTYRDLDVGGRLHELINDIDVKLLSEHRDTDLSEVNRCALRFATVGTFNQKDKEQGNRRVFQSSIDTAAESTWAALKRRSNALGLRRPLIVVYDEAHNLSDQQCELLLELEPDAFLLSTATHKLPRKLIEKIDLLKSVGGKNDSQLKTSINAKTVAETGLIKTTIDLVGSVADMSSVLEQMICRLNHATDEAKLLGLDGSPKAVYVCKTNVVEGSDVRDDPKQRFQYRLAPPILIWRELTEKLGVDPRKIAVYCDLQFKKEYPPPSSFMLFANGDRDYDAFVRSGYKHVIFNQSLQEGWDDPWLSFAYIDKSMGSRIQVEQILGRLLRQPNRIHYASEILNTASVYVRLDRAGIFKDVVDAVQSQIDSGDIAIKLIKQSPGGRPRTAYPPKKRAEVPEVAIITDRAFSEITKAVRELIDFRSDTTGNILGKGKFARCQKVIGIDAAEQFEWVEYGASAQVTVRWLFANELKKTCPNAIGLVIMNGNEDSSAKFDAKIGLDSAAARHVKDLTDRVRTAYFDNVYLKLRRTNPYLVSEIIQASDNIIEYKNAIHSGYEGLNSFERDFAAAVDRTGETWCRNLPRLGYGLPLLSPGRTNNFYPDFLVWKGGDVYLIDTKGSHLEADISRKLLSVRPADGVKTCVYVRFIVDGRLSSGDKTGFTVISFKPNGEQKDEWHEEIDAAVAASLVADAW